MAAYIDPATRDFVIEISGDLQEETLPTRQHLYFRLFTERGSCFWDMNFGSTLHELQQAKITRTFQVDLEDRVRTALADMIDEGEIDELAFTHERLGSNRWHCRIGCVDVAQRPLAFDLWVEVA